VADHPVKQPILGIAEAMLVGDDLVASVDQEGPHYVCDLGVVVVVEFFRSIDYSATPATMSVEYPITHTGHIATLRNASKQPKLPALGLLSLDYRN
jgi:hypothetical protein